MYRLAHLIPEIRVRWSELPIAIWFLLSIHIVIWLIDRTVKWVLTIPFSIKPAIKNASKLSIVRTFCRILIVTAITIPYLLAIFTIHWIKFGDNINPSQYGMSFTQIKLTASDGIKLDGWFIPSQRIQSESTVIIAPDYGMTKAYFLSYAMIISGNGHNVLLFDHRGQGNSEGHTHSFGQLESNDVSGAVNYLKNNHPEESRYIFALGISHGAQAVVTAAAHDQRIRAVVLDSAIIYPDSFTDGITRWLNWPINKYIKTSTTFFASAILRCNLFNNTNLYSNIAKISPRPVLIFHGAMDNVSNSEQAKKLYAQAHYPKKLCVVPGAGHTQVLLYMRNQYMEEITDVFIESMLVR